MWLWTVAGLVVVVAFYVLWFRTWLKTKPWAAGFFAAIEPVEIWLWNKSETILWSRMLMLIGILPPLLDQFQALQGTPVVDLVPEQYRPYLTLSFTVVGIVSELLRRSTTKPIEVVQLPDAMPPAVAAAVADLEQAKQVAVVAVAQDAANVAAAAPPGAAKTE